MAVIRPNDYLDRLQSLAAVHKVRVERVIVVPSIQEWCIANGQEEQNPFRTGRIFQNPETKDYLVVLVEEITPDMQNSVISAMQMHGFDDEVEQLSDPLLFLDHLFLHELAHALNQDATERECDEWAFNQL